MRGGVLIPAAEAAAAPPWSVSGWLNEAQAPTLEALRGKVVVLHAFQMLCPGCVSHGLPQAKRVRAAFEASDVYVVCLHSVFEHHEAMGLASLRAFLHEYRVGLPVCVDRPGVGGPVPQTMAAYQMRGTPTLILIDRRGRLRLHAFGQVEDVVVGAAVASLVAEPRPEDARSLAATPEAAQAGGSSCDASGCRVDAAR